MWPRSPKNWRDTSAWDRLWRAAIDGDPDFLWHAMAGVTGWFWVRDLRDSLHAEGRTKLLFVGNGVSLTPHAFALAGFTTTALDVSGVASEFLRGLDVGPLHLQHFFRKEYEPSAEVLESSRRPGGSVEMICGDLFDPQVAPGPYDVVFSENSLQGFTPPDLVLAVAAIDARVRRPGECRVHVHNPKESFSRIVTAFEAKGYVDCTRAPRAPTAVEKVLCVTASRG